MNPRARITRRRQRGAALILTVVVIMILTTVGMAMVTFTTTEERTATAYRDTLQARSVAEAGVRLVQMMFNDPDERQLVPRFALTATAPTAGGLYDYNGTDQPTTETSLNSIGIFRADRVGATPSKYTGAMDRLFRGPFGESWANAFGGSYLPNNRYDVRFTCTNPNTNVAVGANCWLDTNINSLLQSSADWNLDSGTITDISFYAAPAVNGIQYGITSIRVTAEKRTNGELLASETIEAVIGDNNTKPAVLGNGSVNIASVAGSSCGDGCEQIHANGNVTIGPVSGGEDPIVTATGTVTGPTSPTAASSVPPVLTPEINPWDLTYKPKSPTELARYYLLAARPLDTVWTDGNPIGNPPSRPCGVNGLSQCQDYNLEYDTAGSPKPARTTTMVPAMYRWNIGASEWSLCTTGTTLSCLGSPLTFTVLRLADGPAGAGDTADIPFNVTRVPKTSFEITAKEDGATVLIDGKFEKHGSMDAQMSVIAVGSIHLHSSTTWAPSLANRVMWLSGRDISLFSNCCAPSNTCATNLTSAAYASVMASHEQFSSGSQTALFGVIIAESRVDYDDVVVGPLAINSPNGDHGYSCGQPEWPWTIPTRAVIVSMKSATN